jgi:iron-sulfur cluster assembly protein
MSVMLTEKAASEVKKIISEQKLDPSTVLRVGVAGGGCSGFQYSLGFDTAWDPKADSRSEHSIEKRGFTFNNPNAKKSCGCGSSFQA